MALSRDRIIVQGRSPHVHEQEAVAFAVQALPDSEPYRLWALVDLVDPSGRRYDLDVLVIGYNAIYLVEVKSWPGTISGDTVDWRITWPDGRVSVKENPLRVTEHKARILGSLLDRQLGRDRPYVQPLIFLSHAEVKNELHGAARQRVVTRAGFARAITHGDYPGADEGPARRPINKPIAQKTTTAFQAIGLRPSAGALRLGELVLGELIEEGPGYQDREARHEHMPEIRRRVRSYLVPESTTQERRDQLHRAAEREARLLTLLSDHKNILRLVSYVPEGPTGGPCVVFEHFEDAQPLSKFLRTTRLTFDERIRILENLGEALEYCHRKKVLHRGLHPEAVLVRKQERPGEAADLEVRLYNFQLAQQEGGSQGTAHLSALAPDDTALYRAPEMIEDPNRASTASDVFSLGAVAYHVLVGRPPGTTLAERAQLLATGGLSVAAASDDLAGALADERKSLDEVVRFATEPNRIQRADSAIEWVNLLLEAATGPEPESETFVSPLDARPGERLARDLETRAILGTGSTARVLRVRRGDSDYALKVAISPEHDERVRAESDVLRRLDGKGDCIVGLQEMLVLGDRTCLLMTDAGDTLADLLAKEGPVSLDYARRWGDDLLRAIEKLEEKSIQHRDIKPANLGVLPGTAKKKRHLLLFDFSLSTIEAAATTAGTPAYRDPFLHLRRGWDEAADRFAAAMSLYEMITGTLPRWGKGAVAATASDEEISLDAERFDASIRDRLLKFFRRALARNVAARFDSAERMRTAWQACFDTLVVTPDAETRASESLAEQRPLQLDGSIEALQLSARAKNALDRAGIVTVEELLGLPKNEVVAMRGVGLTTAREILRFIEQYAPLVDLTPNEERFFVGYEGPDAAVAFIPELAADAVSALEDAGLDHLRRLAATSRERVDRVLARFAGARDLLIERLRVFSSGATNESEAPRTLDGWIQALVPPPSGRGQTFLRHVRLLLGLDLVGGERITEAAPLAKKLDLSRAKIYQSLTDARGHWQAHPDLLVLHRAVESAVTAFGGAAAITRIAEPLLTALAPDVVAAERPVALRKAEALARIAAETSEALHLSRIHDVPWLFLSADLVGIVRCLGDEADEIAQREPLPSSEEVRDKLLAIVRDTPLSSISIDRLVALAAEGSQNAARSARLELYPRRMPAERALKLSAGALPMFNLGPEQARRAVQARYPDAEQIPDRPELDELLRKLGLQWNEQRLAYVRPGAVPSLSNRTQAVPDRRKTTHTTHRPARSPETEAAEEFDAQIRLAAEHGHFRVVEVTAGFDVAAAVQLGHRVGVEPRSLERELIEIALELGHELEVETAAIYGADREGPSGEGWAYLKQLMQKSAARLLDKLLGEHTRLVLTEPGLLARYQLDDFLRRLVEAASRDDSPAIFLVVPTTDDLGPATIDAATGPLPIPTATPGQRIRAPLSWIENLHRGAA